MRIINWIITIAVIVGCLFVGYWALNPIKAPTWTGFGPYNEAIQGARAKTLWDWLDLLLVPFFLAVGAWILTSIDKEADRKTETDRQRQDILISLYQKVSDLLVDKNLRKPRTSYEVRSIARAYAMSAFRLLDPGRKAEVLQFLSEAGLIDNNPTINLNGANMKSIQLDYASLIDIEIKGAHFEGASLKWANIANTNFCGSSFIGANFRGAIINKSDFSFTYLNKADLRGCDLSNVNLKGAILLNAKLKGTYFLPEQLNYMVLDKKQLSKLRSQNG